MAAFLKAIARQGAAGGTARWAAHLYHRWVRLTPEDPLCLRSLLTALIATRYDVHALVRSGGGSPGIRAALGALDDAGRIRGLCHAVVLILTAEGDYAGRPAEEQEMLVEVVGEELTAMGVPPENAFGRDLTVCPHHLCAVYRPSVRMLRLLLAA